MFRHSGGKITVNPPAVVLFNGYRHGFADLSREQLDEAGCNEAVPIDRRPYTSYTTERVKGEDLVYRETIVAESVDLEAMAEGEGRKVRAERDVRLANSDWTQVVDTPLDDLEIVLWQSYRQALRDVPQQPGFPMTVE